MNTGVLLVMGLVLLMIVMIKGGIIIKKNSKKKSVIHYDIPSSPYKNQKIMPSISSPKVIKLREKEEERKRLIKKRAESMSQETVASFGEDQRRTHVVTPLNIRELEERREKKEQDSLRKEE